MPTAVQFRRGTTAQHSSFTGAVGELTVDTDKEVVVVHDGATAGGFPLAGTNYTNVFTKGQAGSIVTLTDGATITPNFSQGNNFKVTLAGNRTLANPTNIVAGQSGVIAVSQDATGSRTLAFGTYWKFKGGTAPTLTTTANATDVIAYYCASATLVYASVVANVS